MKRIVPLLSAVLLVAACAKGTPNNPLLGPGESPTPLVQPEYRESGASAGPHSPGVTHMRSANAPASRSTRPNGSLRDGRQNTLAAR